MLPCAKNSPKTIDKPPVFCYNENERFLCRIPSKRSPFPIEKSHSVSQKSMPHHLGAPSRLRLEKADPLVCAAAWNLPLL